jgi:hypothetical protein
MANRFQSNNDAWGYSYFNGAGESQNSYAGEKSKYFNSDGSLKSGYSQREIFNNSGVGEVATYRNESYSDDDDDLVQRFGIFQTGPTESGGDGNGDGGASSPRDTGEFEDIIGSLQDDIAAADQRAQDFANQQAQGIADNTAALTAQFEERLALLTEGFNTRYGQLESVFEKQSASMMQFQQQMQGQMQQAQNSYNQQVQMMQNIQNSRVPVAEENAFTAQIGDQREDSSRDKENNRLSDLSILSGLGTSSNPTSGLSLA